MQASNKFWPYTGHANLLLFATIAFAYCLLFFCTYFYRIMSEVKRKLFQYSPHKVGLALGAIRSGMKVSTAAKTYGIPRSTLRNKLSGVAPESSGHVGPQPVLGSEIEAELVRWIIECSRSGFPVDKDGLCDSVQRIVTKQNLVTPFINNRPSRSWFEGFMSRHPDISQKHAEYINKARAAITEVKIRNWFQEIAELIGTENLKVLDDPSRIWNCDETSFFLAPKGALVLAEKGQHVYDTSKNSDKENITTLFTVNALGEYAPPLTVYKYKRISSEIVQNAPPGWGIGKTDKGWMTGEAFYEYVANIFIPYLKNRETVFPVILFLDGHKSHLTMHLSQLCRQNNIIVVALVPNTTHMMQPLDVAVFFPLKQSWRKLVKKWRIDNDGMEITKINLPSALHSLLVDDESFSNNIKSGFKTCGLYPFGADFVNYKRIVKQSATGNVNQCFTESAIAETYYLDYLEKKIDATLLLEFKETCDSGNNWQGCKEALMLYETWLAFRNDTETVTFKLSSELDAPSTSSSASCNNKENINIPSSPSIFQNESLMADSIEDNKPTSSDISPGKENKSLKPSVSQNPSVDQNISFLGSAGPSSIIFNQPNTVNNLLKECLLWPEKKIPQKISNKSKYIPSVITSDKWLEIMQAAEKETNNKKEKKKKTPDAQSFDLRSPVLQSRKRKHNENTGSDTEGEEGNCETYVLNDSDTDCDEWIPEPVPTEFSDLNRRPEVNDFVLVQFKKPKNIIYYIGKILAIADEDDSFEISYYRKKNRFTQQFITPLEPDLALVSLSDIKIILPPPILTGATKRQNSYISFEVNLSNFNVL